VFGLIPIISQSIWWVCSPLPCSFFRPALIAFIFSDVVIVKLLYSIVLPLPWLFQGMFYFLVLLFQVQEAFSIFSVPYHPLFVWGTVQEVHSTINRSL